MLDVRPLSCELAEIAKNELNENEKRLELEVNILRDWISKQPHLVSRQDNKFLVFFLRASKHRVEDAKKKIEMFYTLKDQFHNFLRGPSIQDRNTEVLIRLGMYVPLPSINGKSSPSILLIRPGILNPKLHKAAEVMKAFSLICELQAEEDDNSRIAGIHVIIDGSNVTPSHTMQYDFNMLKVWLNFYQNLSYRIHGIHFVNVPSVAELAAKAFFIFLPDKIIRRIHSYGNDLNQLFEVIPQKLFPAEYRGAAGSIPDILDDWVEKIKSNSKTLAEWNKYGVDNTKIMDKSKLDENIYGMEGNFKTLCFD